MSRFEQLDPFSRHSMAARESSLPYCRRRRPHHLPLNLPIIPVQLHSLTLWAPGRIPKGLSVASKHVTPICTECWPIARAAVQRIRGEVSEARHVLWQDAHEIHDGWMFPKWTSLCLWIAAEHTPRHTPRKKAK